jgi:hypothetical protein
MATEHKRRQGNRKMIYLVELYQKEHGEEGEEIDLDSVSHWALEEGKYKLKPVSPQKILRRMMAQALRGDHTTDPQGREVRKYHFVTQQDDSGKTTSRAYDIFNAPPDHMKLSLSLRRRSALKDVAQLELDLQSYNDNNKFGETIEGFDYNFNKDLEEGAMPTDYPSEAPEDNDIYEDDEEDNQN